MKGWVNLALAVFSVFGFIGWMWRLQSGEPITFFSAFFTFGSAIGILVFSSGAMEAWKK